MPANTQGPQANTEYPAVMPGNVAARANKEYRADMPGNAAAATFKTFYYMFTCGSSSCCHVNDIMTLKGHARADMGVCKGWYGFT